jgi:fumarylpyruvate hydrolase
MGFTGREPPFFFMKPADGLLHVPEGTIGEMPYPPGTANLHYEMELVAAIGVGGTNIKAADAMKHVWGYAVGLDMTRRDLQNDAKKQGRPWEIGKAFDASGPIGSIVPAANAGNIAETIEHLSAYWRLEPGDLIFTGTPEGVGAVVRGDLMQGSVEGVAALSVKMI